jgi:hypothetical protein
MRDDNLALSEKWQLTCCGCCGFFYRLEKRDSAAQDVVDHWL